MNVWVGIVSSGLSLVTALVTTAVVLGRYREKVAKLEKDRDRLLDKVDGIREDLAGFREWKVYATKFIDDKIYTSKSPLSLTDFGKRLLEENGFWPIFEERKDDLVSKLEKMNPTTQYEVQEKARELMDSLTKYEPFRPIEQSAFDTGSDFGQILRAGAIPLRDYYFLKHSEIVNPHEAY